MVGHSDQDRARRGHPPPEGATATALTPEARDLVSTLRVSAHIGSVTLRKHGSVWVAEGADGCTVPPRRIERALDALSNLRATPSPERVPDGSAFELEIVALIEQKLALHLEIAARNGSGDLVRLVDDSVFRVQGLDRKLWATTPAAWCTGS